MPVPPVGDAVESAEVMSRSWLFVPGDSPAKMNKALGAGADVIILDLEDAVAPANKPQAREATRDFLMAHKQERAAQIWVRINPLSTTFANEDLAAVVMAGPDGILLPKTDSGEDVRELDRRLNALETAFGVLVGHIKIVPIATETARSVFALNTYANVSQRLLALTWGAEDLPAAVGAASGRHDDGSLTDLCRMARSLCLAGAAVANVTALETVYPAFRDLAGLEAYAAKGRKEGFTGMLAIHPSQVPVINKVFTPTLEEVAYAQKIVDLFAANPGLGVVSVDGRMVDAPHLKQAQRILGLTRS
ncbi:MAG: CoA ester lyase [Rhodospirillaceae bacterium]|nr:CoA ester lyase [Rhodospirillaceae bacterium]